jgi:hypothetical protein
VIVHGQYVTGIRFSDAQAEAVSLRGAKWGAHLSLFLRSLLSVNDPEDAPSRYSQHACMVARSRTQSVSRFITRKTRLSHGIVMKKQRRVLVWHERTHCYLFFRFPRARRTWGCGAVAGHSAIQAGGPGTIDVNSASVSPHF